MARRGSALQEIQTRVYYDMPMMTLETTQASRGSQALQWKVERQGIFYRWVDKALQYKDLNSAWIAHNQAGDRHIAASPAAIRKLQAQYQELLPKAEAIFQQAAAPFMVMDSLQLKPVDPPQKYIANAVKQVLDKLKGPLDQAMSRAPADLGIIHRIPYGYREYLGFSVNQGSRDSIYWNGTYWGLYENLNDVIAQADRWLRMVNAITDTMRSP